jgi:membrane-associated protein
MIDFLTQALDVIRHLDVHLENIMREYQLATYLILALIIFCETGPVVTPFLPGDSLLFAAGAITAKTGILNVWLLIPLLFLSAILGDNTNYFFGKYLGSNVFTRDYWFLKRRYTDHERRSSTPNTAAKRSLWLVLCPSCAHLPPSLPVWEKWSTEKFIYNCVLGGILWVTSLTLAGYFFGQIEIIKNNFEIVVFGIIGVSLLPIAVEFFRARFGKKKMHDSGTLPICLGAPEQRPVSTGAGPEAIPRSTCR